MTRTRLYRDGALVAENFPVEDISDHVQEPDATIWLDLCAPGEADLAAVSEEFGLHPLSVEDALHQRQRAKLDRYDDHLFVNAYAVRVSDAGELSKTEVSAFVTNNALVTVRRDPQFDIEEVVSRWDTLAKVNGKVNLPRLGVAFLLHGLLDAIVDGHFEAVQQLDEMIDELEDALFDDQVDQTVLQRRSFALRRSLVSLRRVVLPMRELVYSVMRGDAVPMNEALTPYYRDVYDHVLRATEWTESLRDVINTVLETLLTIQGNQLNMVMKKITAWAAIIGVPTAITGFYGQNVPYPGFGHLSGFYVSLAAIIGLSSVLYVMFRRADWL